MSEYDKLAALRSIEVVKELDKMRPVYDAAMAWFELHDQPGSEKESEAWIAFRQACRRAKEGM